MDITELPQAVVPLRYREDGWTPDVQRAFIEALAASGSVARACGVVRRSASTAYRLRARPDAHAFRAAWSAATALAYRQVFEIAMDRIVEGQEIAVFHDGERVGFKTVHSDRLLCFMLDHLRPDGPAPVAVIAPRGPGDRQDYELAASLAGLAEATVGDHPTDAAIAAMDEAEAALAAWHEEIDGPPPPPLPPGPTMAEFDAMTERQKTTFYSGADPFAVTGDEDDDDGDDCDGNDCDGDGDDCEDARLAYECAASA